MADNRHPDHPSLLPFSHSSTSTADFSFSSLPRSRRSHSSPAEFFRLFPAISLTASEDKSKANGSLADGLFSGGKLFLPLSFFRNARSLDYRRLQDHCHTNHRSREPADCGCGTGVASSVNSVGPKWYKVLTLGVARVSQKMELEDMRKRQIRRCPAEEGEEGGRREKRRRTAGWKVMSALSCNGLASVAVAPSIAGVTPQPS